MRAVTWHGKRDVRVEQVPDPTIREPNDAIVGITSTNICGSDLHLYEVLGAFMEPGDILGHEPMGVVEEVGPEAVGHISPGDRVVIPFNISCGRCWMCERQLFAQCETTQNREHGKGASLFGYTKLYGQVPGGQAEFLRVPQARFGPIQVPEGPPDDRFLYLSDILPTGWQAARYADVPPGGTVAVYGLGPVGQFAARSARVMGADRVFGVDLVPERLEMARRHGIEAVNATAVDDVPAFLLDQTAGRGPDSVVDAVGMEAHGNPVAKIGQEVASRLPGALGEKAAEQFGVDRLKALLDSIRTVRRGGTLSVSGVYGGAIDPLPMMEMFDKGIQIRMGQCHVRRWISEIMPYLEDDADPLGTADMASHYLPLEQAPEGYEKFQKKADGCTKVVLQPGRTEPEVYPGGVLAAQQPVRAEDLIQVMRPGDIRLSGHRREPVFGRGTDRDGPARVAVSAARRRAESGAAGADCGGSRTRAGSRRAGSRAAGQEMEGHWPAGPPSAHASRLVGGAVPATDVAPRADVAMTDVARAHMARAHMARAQMTGAGPVDRRRSVPMLGLTGQRGWRVHVSLQADGDPHSGPHQCGDHHDHGHRDPQGKWLCCVVHHRGRCRALGNALSRWPSCTWRSSRSLTLGRSAAGQYPPVS